jgi:mRNA interferase MazF
VVQSNSFNASAIRTVVVAAISSNLDLAMAPGNVRLPKSATRLKKPSVVNVSQLLTLDRSVLDQRAGTLGPRHMNAVSEGLKLVLPL